MKKLAIAVILVAGIIAFISYNVWRATVEPVSTPPGLVQIGAQQLHTQLQRAAAREAEIEKLDWNSIPLLRQLIQAHQQRIEKLSGNTQAGEIIAHDKEAIARLQKRIDDLTAAANAQAAPQPAQGSESSTPPAVARPSHPQRPAAAPSPTTPK